VCQQPPAIDAQTLYRIPRARLRAATLPHTTRYLNTAAPVAQFILCSARVCIPRATSRLDPTWFAVCTRTCAYHVARAHTVYHVCARVHTTCPSLAWITSTWSQSDGMSPTLKVTDGKSGATDIWAESPARFSVAPDLCPLHVCPFHLTYVRCIHVRCTYVRCT
jgi:hypothetical protein